MSSAITNKKPASGCEAPDLDWSQVRETVSVLNVSVAQIEASMREGDDSVSSLTDSFTYMTSVIHTIDGLVSRLGEGEDDEQLHNMIKDNCRAVKGMVEASIIAFQFYDKLTQRLAHVAGGLGEMSELIRHSERLYNPNEWRQLQDAILSHYSTEIEHLIHDAVRRGEPVNETVERILASQEKEQVHSAEIELF